MAAIDVTDEASRCDWVGAVQKLAVGALTFNTAGGFGVRSALLGAATRRYSGDGFNTWIN